MLVPEGVLVSPKEVENFPDDRLVLLTTGSQGEPLSALTRFESRSGPEFTMRYNLYRSAQIIGAAAPGYSSAQALSALEQVFDETMPAEMGYAWSNVSYQEKKAAEGVPVWAIFSFSVAIAALWLRAVCSSLASRSSNSATRASSAAFRAASSAMSWPCSTISASRAASSALEVTDHHHPGTHLVIKATRWAGHQEIITGSNADACLNFQWRKSEPRDN